jgi:DNA-binding transcriptional MerR regulator
MKAREQMAEGFSSREVAKLSGMKFLTGDYWDRSGFLSPSLRRAQGRGSSRRYSFRDLIAIRTACALRKQGVPLQHLRHVVAYLRTVEGLEHPLAGTRLIVAGDDVIMVRGDRALVSVLRAPGQYVLRMVLDLERLVTDTVRAVQTLQKAA